MMRILMAALTAFILCGGVAASTLPATHVATEAVNVRAEPSAGAARVGRISAGQVVRVVERSADGAWLRIERSDGAPAGFVAARYLRLGSATADSAAAAEPSLFARAMMGGAERPAPAATARAEGDSVFGQAARSGEIGRQQAEGRRIAAERAAEQAREQARRDAARQAEEERKRAARAEEERREAAQRERDRRETQEMFDRAAAEQEADRQERAAWIDAQRREREAGFERQQRDFTRQLERETERRRAEAARRASDEAAQRQREEQQIAARRAEKDRDADDGLARRSPEQRWAADQRVPDQQRRQSMQQPSPASAPPASPRPAPAAMVTDRKPAAGTTAARRPATERVAEALSYCWPSSTTPGHWFCDGPSQKLLTVWPLAQALELAGCADQDGRWARPRDDRRVKFQDGFLYYCEHARPGNLHWRPVVEHYAVPAPILGARRIHECRVPGDIVCTR